ncbi:MAG: zinc protease [Cyclobacteriaceae bacterium]|nr:MAG: zinc protease [Cyclobacteriaceae bacterium]
MPDRSKQPPFQKSLQFHLKEPLAVNQPCKAPVFLLNGGDQEIIRLEFVFRAGKWFEPAPGLSHFTTVMLTRGTTGMSGNEIANRLDELGYHIETGSSSDYAYFTVYGLTDNLPQAAEIIRKCLTESCFLLRELRLEKEIYLQQLKVNQEKTSYLASRLFRQHLFGREHPYASEPEPEQLNAFTSQMLTDYFSSHYRDFDLFVTGKFNSHTEKSVLGLIEQLPWQRHADPENAVHPAVEKQVILPKPDAVQASIRVGKPCISRQHADYPYLALGIYLLGGFFGSRLMKVIREEKGLTYGIHAHIQTYRKASVFSVAADVNRQHADAAIEECLRQIKELREGRFSDKELDLARNHFIGSLQNEMSNAFAHMERFKALHLFQLPSDYYQNLLIKIDQACKEDIAFAIEKHIHENDMIIAVAG